jgi:hypothetical protein
MRRVVPSAGLLAGVAGGFLVCIFGFRRWCGDIRIRDCCEFARVPVDRPGEFVRVPVDRRREFIRVGVSTGRGLAD